MLWLQVKVYFNFNPPPQDDHLNLIFHNSHLFIGGATTPANPAYNVKELTHQVSLSEAKVLLCSPENVAIALETAQQCGLSQSNVFVLGDSAVNGVLPYTTLAKSGRQLSAPIRVSNPADQVAYMCFSSGTTGLSKGVMTT